MHDEAEVDVAVAAGATLIGVNQRDLATFEVDTDRAERVAASIPPGSSGSPSRVSAAPTTSAGWPTPATTPCSSARHSCAGDPAAAVAALRGA